MSEMRLRGTVLGFETYQDYVLKNTFGVDSPFSVLECTEEAFNFVVVDPFFIKKDYKFEIEDEVVQQLQFGPNPYDEMAILCIVRLGKGMHSVNFRAPLVINTKEGLFRQTVLSDDSYLTSTPFVLTGEE